MKNRVSAAFSALVDRNASEAYVFWINIALTIAARFVPGVSGFLDDVSVAACGAPFSTLAAGMLAYITGRMVSKAAKAPLSIP